MKRGGLNVYQGTIPAFGGTRQNEAESLILRYRPNIDNYHPELSVVAYVKVPSKHLEIPYRIKHSALYQGTVQVSGSTHHNKAECLILRYCPNIWRYQIEESGVGYNEAASKLLEVPSIMKRCGLY